MCTGIYCITILCVYKGYQRYKAHTLHFKYTTHTALHVYKADIAAALQTPELHRTNMHAVYFQIRKR